jgi:glycosyltransferase involved in cell wall biosynthesis
VPAVRLNGPVISVITPTKNRLPLLREAMRSVQQQSLELFPS